MKISIIIPAYNEEKRIGKTIPKILAYLKNRKFNYELIIVNDGSTDKTNAIVKNFVSKNRKIRLIENKKNSGKGYSVKRGILNAKNPIILFSDADLSTPIQELDKFIPFINDYDIIIASRRLKESNIVVKQPFIRVLFGGIFSLFVRLMINPELKDVQCGFKLFKKKSAKEIFKRQTINRWTFDAEIMYIAKKLNYNVKEIPVTWIDSKASKLNALRDPLIMFSELFKIRFNGLIGRYKQ